MIVNGFVQADISKCLDEEPSSTDSVSDLDDVTGEQDLSENFNEDDAYSDEASFPDADLEENKNFIVIDSSSEESDLSY